MPASPKPFAKLTVTVLKKELKKRGLDTSGKKADLVERLTAHESAGAASDPPTKEAAVEIEPNPNTDISPEANGTTADTVKSADTLQDVTSVPGSVTDEPPVAEVSDSTSKPDETEKIEAPEKEPAGTGTPEQTAAAVTGCEDEGDVNAEVVDDLDYGDDDVEDAQPAAAESAPAAQTKPKPWIHITNLRRPMNLALLRGLLEEYGPLAHEDDVLMTDKRKTQCCAKFESASTAAEASDALEGMKWSPRGETMVLSCRNVEDNILLGMAAGAIPTAAAVYRPVPAPAALSASARVDPPARKELPRRVPTETPRYRVTYAPPVQPAALDGFFRKTKTEPVLYWQPLSDAEVAKREADAKLQAALHEARRNKANDDLRKSSTSKRRSRSRSPRRRRSPPIRRRSRSPDPPRSPRGGRHSPKQARVD